MKRIKDNFHFIIIGAFFLFAFCILILGGADRIVLSKNGVLDMFIPQYQALKNQGAFFAQDVNIDALGSTNRDFFYSEVKFASTFFIIFPSYIAYIMLYFSKIIIAISGVYVFGRSVAGENIKKYSKVLYLTGLFYGILNVFPAYWIAFASIPWLLALIVKTNKKISVAVLLGFFVYPIFSDMLHFGLFIVVSIFVYSIVRWIKYKRFPLFLTLGNLLLIAGYALSEYRYVRQVWRGYIDIIYTVDEWSDFSFSKIAETIDRLYINYKYMRYMIAYGIIPLAIVFACLLFVIVRKKSEKSVIINIIAIAGIIAVVCTNTEYNDLLHTITGTDGTATYREYYSTECFANMLKDIDYKGQWMCGYGIDGGVLQYSGIKTINGTVDIPLCRFENMYDEEIAKALGNVPDTEVVTASFDTDTLKENGTRYLCSSAKIDNASEQGFTFVNSYAKNEGNIYLYITTSRYKSREVQNVKFEDRISLTYDLNELDAILDETDELLTEVTDYKNSHPDMSDEEIVAALSGERIRELYNEMADYIGKISTVKSIAEISVNRDVTNTDAQEKSEEITSDALDMMDEINAEIREICKTSYYLIIEEELGESYVEAMLDYEDMTEEEKEREERKEALEYEYYQAVAKDYTYEYNGQTWTEDKLYEEYTNMDWSEVIAIYEGIIKEKSAELGEIYLEIVAINNEIAKEEGYDNYAEYAYAHYCRDYTVEDAKILFNDVKKYGSGYSQMINDVYTSVSDTEISREDVIKDDRTTFETILPYVAKIDGEAGVSLQHLLDYNLFDLTPLDTKTSRGYTTKLSYYGDAYIFDSPYMSVNDFYTYVHEFGHYNNDYYSNENIFEQYSNLDVAEIHSQGLEALMNSHYSEMFGEEIGNYLEINNINSLVNSTVNACLVAEFEIYAYEHPDSTVEELGKYYHKLCSQYGGYSLLSDVNYDWLDISHVFATPFYYISYATSGLSALQIYCISYEDYDLAVEKYLELTAMPSYVGYKSANKFIGTKDIFKKGNVRAIYLDTYSIIKKKVS